MNGKQFSNKVRNTMKVMDEKNLPYTYVEVTELVQRLDGNMEDIKAFIDGYEKHLFGGLNENKSEGSSMIATSDKIHNEEMLKAIITKTDEKMYDKACLQDAIKNNVHVLAEVLSAGYHSHPEEYQVRVQVKNMTVINYYTDNIKRINNTVDKLNKLIPNFKLWGS